jgi:hypothetical protein
VGRFYAKPTWTYYLIIFLMDMLPLWLMANFGAALGLPEKAVSAVKRTLEGLNSIHDRESGLSFFMREYFNYTPDEVHSLVLHQGVLQTGAVSL